ncbi:class I SAM-dependent DNA methyltransferase [Micromonospora andamanensis]|uniref:DNA methylase adenine-specific domain-containing protein n=1 Tax=Micromonospora andamanensis TaxID=1287068 RepID=A0ABQ4I2Q4_9ACTN|nr:N-6 DNA methylase [Micromonospora andamanensis]GIJ12190.1 hypothetical protein Van01_54040 [Micromonospora andamanensis]
MVEEREGRAEIRAKLQAAGYRLVQLDPKIDSHSSRRVDALAYAANADGDLVPWLAVEVKSGANVKPQVALSQLRKWRELLGTVEHYAVINSQWFRADRSMRSMVPVNGPVVPVHGDFGSLTDPALATALLMDRLWFEAEKARSKGHRDIFFPPAELLAETATPGIETASGEFVPVRHDVLWQARRRALASFALKGPQAEEHTTAPVIADAVGRLIGKKLVGTVLDPFCGTGNFLWAAMDRARDLDGPVEFVGQEINTQLAELAEQIARTAPAPATITTGDAFTTELPEADVIVTAPPFGPPMRRPWTLPTGVPAREIEVAAIDLCVRKLRPGGRAVFLLPNNITFKQTLESYRRYLASEYRVGALIGLPAGALEGTTIRAVLLVIDRAEPGETFVAQLGEDWAAQLSETGAAMNAALEHLDGE